MNKDTNISLAPKVRSYKKDRRAQTSSDIQQEKRSNYSFYKPSGELTEMKLEKRYLIQKQKKRWNEFNHRILGEKRQDEEMIFIMGTWSKNRCRVEKEI